MSECFMREADYQRYFVGDENYEQARCPGCGAGPDDSHTTDCAERPRVTGEDENDDDSNR